MFLVNKVIYSFFTGIVITVGFLGCVIFTEFNRQELIINFLDIGQGDSVFITTPQGRDIIIDGGPDNTLAYKLGKYLPFYDRKIDLLVLTHPDSDHLTGFVEVLKRYEVKNVLMTGVYDDLPAYQEFLKIIQNNNINTLIAGDIKFIQVESDLLMEIFYPFESLANKVFENNNEHSLVFKLSYGNFSALFTGDATYATEEELMSRGLNLDSDILKLGHHGSDTSSGYEFLQKVGPELVVILVGKNRFGHPDQDVLKRLKDLSTKYLSTKDEGDIIVSVNQQDFEVYFPP